MNIEHSLQFWIHHNEAIIQWIVVAILATTALWLVRMLTDKPKKDAPTSSANFSEIEETLKKLLERASAVVATPTSPTLEQAFAKSSGAAAAADPGLKAELEKREKEIAELKNQLSSMPKVDSAQFTAKITELETKLAEYEILEDDIADLSLYKEENVRLKQELGKLKGGEVAEASPAIPEPAAEEVPGADAFPEFPEVEAAAPAPAPVKKEENLVAAFEEAVKQDVAAAAPTPPAPAPAPIAAAPAPAPAPASSSKSAEVDTDDILAEFSGEGLDTDKMLAEIESLNSAGEGDSSALEEASDINKMAEEASKLGS